MINEITIWRDQLGRAVGKVEFFPALGNSWEDRKTLERGRDQLRRAIRKHLRESNTVWPMIDPLAGRRIIYRVADLHQCTTGHTHSLTLKEHQII